MLWIQIDIVHLELFLQKLLESLNNYLANGAELDRTVRIRLLIWIPAPVANAFRLTLCIMVRAFMVEFLFARNIS